MTRRRPQGGPGLPPCGHVGLAAHPPRANLDLPSSQRASKERFESP
jgi:hypothetical protein